MRSENQIYIKYTLDIYNTGENYCIFNTFFCSRSHAEYLQRLLPTSAVVKAFNVLSAYVLESGGIQGSKEVSTCKIIKSFAES